MRRFGLFLLGLAVFSGLMPFGRVDRTALARQFVSRDLNRAPQSWLAVAETELTATSAAIDAQAAEQQPLAVSRLVLLADARFVVPSAALANCAGSVAALRNTVQPCAP
jgi:hypothetical protein